MLQVFSINVYDLLDSSATLLFINPLVSRELNMLPAVLMVPFSVTTFIGDAVMARRVFRSFLISLTHKFTLVELVELDMVDFDVILGNRFVEF